MIQNLWVSKYFSQNLTLWINIMIKGTWYNQVPCSPMVEVASLMQTFVVTWWFLPITKIKDTFVRNIKSRYWFTNGSWLLAKSVNQSEKWTVLAVLDPSLSLADRLDSQGFFRHFSKFEQVELDHFQTWVRQFSSLC